MMRVLGNLFVFTALTLTGCGNADVDRPATLTPEEEQEILEQIDAANKAEAPLTPPVKKPRRSR